MSSNPTTPEERAALRAAKAAEGAEDTTLVTPAYIDYSSLAYDLAPRLADDVDRLTAERDEARANGHAAVKEEVLRLESALETVSRLTAERDASQELLQRCCDAPLKVELLTAEVERLKKLLDRDHTGLAAGLNRVQQIIAGYGWIPLGHWGSYEWDERTEKNFRAEVGRCFDEAEKAAKQALRESGVRADAAFRPEKDQIAALQATVSRLEAALRQCKEATQAWRAKAAASREESGRIRRTIKAATDAEERCLVRAEVWDACADNLDAINAALPQTEKE